LLAGILHRPSLIILDEPTVGTDVQSRNAIIEYLCTLNKQGMTILYTSHHLDEAQDLCHRIAIIDEGKNVVTGKPLELIGQHEGVNDLEGLFLQLTGKRLRD
jgi:ABC-2 type transport system ATP-binding protein